MERVVSVMQRLARWRLVMAIVVMYLLPSALCAIEGKMLVAYDTYQRDFRFGLVGFDGVNASGLMFDIWTSAVPESLYGKVVDAILTDKKANKQIDHTVRAIQCGSQNEHSLELIIPYTPIQQKGLLAGRTITPKILKITGHQAKAKDFAWRSLRDLNPQSQFIKNEYFTHGNTQAVAAPFLSQIVQQCPALQQKVQQEAHDVYFSGKKKKQGRHAGGSSSLQLQDLETKSGKSDCVRKMGENFDTGGYAWPRPQQPDALHFYKSNPKYANTYEPPGGVVIDRKQWRSVEHYFQAHKFKKPREVYEQYLKDTQAGDLQKASRKKQIPFDGKKYNMLSDQKWRGKNFNFHVMYKALQHKFAPDTSLGGMLKDTGNSFLVEDTAQAKGKSQDKDTLYGAGDYYTGCNMLGQMLMYVREELQGKRKPTNGKFPGFQTPEWWYKRLFSSHGKRSGGRGQHKKKKKHGDHQKLKKALERLGGALQAIS